MKPLTLILVLCVLLPGCATIHRHPRATAIIVGVAAGAVVGYELGHHKGCPHYINGYGYDGTPPCPTSCDGPGDCYWPPKK